VTLLGHFRGVAGARVSLAPDLNENLARADGFERQATKMVDEYIQARGLDAPTEELPQLRHGYEQAILEELDLRTAGINTVIWATGYTFDFSLVRMPIFDEKGFPIQTRGVTGNAGLYFVGMPWMPTLKSGILAGVGEFAQHIAGQIIEASR
jgi:putative flavoprotein involved in K+ transport